MNIPEGYAAHDGLACPVDPEAMVDLIIRTGLGLMHSGACRALHHVWEWEAHEDGIGAVVAWRLASREPVDIKTAWPEFDEGEQPPAEAE